MSTETRDLEPSWMSVMGDEFEQPYWKRLESFVARERASTEVFPPAEDVFNAFGYTPFGEVRVVILGQDPYHDHGQAHGLCFSVRRGVPVPPSLRNIFKEIHSQLGVPIPSHGELTSWARQGILLLNTVLTVRAHQANSHRRQGWETFTDRVIDVLNARKDGLVFVLWGAPARKKAGEIDGSRHLVLQAGHPSPLSIRYFRNNGHFRRINEYLESGGQTVIDWSVP